MARNYAAIQHTIWADPDWRTLSVPAQLLYFTALSHPTLTLAGILDWRPAKLAALAETWDRQAIEAAAHELEANNYLIIDHDTEEAFVRSFHRNDHSIKQLNLGTTIARACTPVASPLLHNHISAELWRLHDDHPEYKGFNSDELREYMNRRPPIHPPRAPHDNPRIDPSDDPSNDPRIDPSNDPQNPEIEGSDDPSGGGSSGGSPKPRTTNPKPQTPSGYGEWERSLGADANPSEPPEDDSPDSADASRRPAGAVEDPADARCVAHRGVPAGEVPPCGGCATVRRRAEGAARIASGRASERHSAAVGGCALCDESGWAEAADGGVFRCGHDAGSAERAGWPGGEVIPIREVS